MPRFSVVGPKVPALIHPDSDPQPSLDDEYESHSRKSTVSGPDEEAPVYSFTRMLQDSRGRLRTCL